MKGNRALVSGGQGGIGRATVAALAAADHIVAVADLDGGAALPGAAEAEPEDIAAVIAFLASPQAGHITGQVIRVDGGQYL